MSDVYRKILIIVKFCKNALIIIGYGLTIRHPTPAYDLARFSIGVTSFKP